MLSYMLPAVEEKQTTITVQQQRNINLSLSLNSNNNHHKNNRDSCDDDSDENTRLLNSERDNSFLDTNENDNTKSDNFNTDNISNRKFKYDDKSGSNKSIPKRVSFGSSKGSMVETLVFETPTPLPEHAEKEFTFSSDSHNNIDIIKQQSENININNEGTELQEEVERSKVRVTFFQSNKPQQVSSLENHLVIFTENNNSIIYETILSDKYSIDDNMATVTASIPVTYDRQISAESGWDNPFRPGGDLSKEADEIVNLIKGGKPITPTGEPNISIANGEIQNTIENGTTVVDGVTKIDAHQLQSTQNGTKSPHKNLTVNDKPSKNGENPSKSQTQISNQVLPAPQSASHVTIEDKKKKKSCCVIQ